MEEELQIHTLSTYFDNPDTSNSSSMNMVFESEMMMTSAPKSSLRPRSISAAPEVNSSVRMNWRIWALDTCNNQRLERLRFFGEAETYFAFMKIVEHLLHEFLPVQCFLERLETVVRELASRTELLNLGVCVQVDEGVVKVEHGQHSFSV